MDLHQYPQASKEMSLEQLNDVVSMVVLQTLTDGNNLK